MLTNVLRKKTALAELVLHLKQNFMRKSMFTYNHEKVNSFTIIIMKDNRPP